MYGIKNILSKLSLGLMVSLAPVTLAILVTWNTLPGQALYPIKRGLETVALLILSPSFQAKSSLQAGLVDRRTQEATALLASSRSSQGLEELKAQIAAAKADVSNAKNVEAKREAAIRLKTKLEEAQQELQKTKTTIASVPSTGTTTNTYYPPANQPTNTYTNPTTQPTTYVPPTQPPSGGGGTQPPPTQPPSTQPPSGGGGDDEIIDEIDDTISGIGDDIDDIDDIIQNPNVPEGVAAPNAPSTNTPFVNPGGHTPPGKQPDENQEEEDQGHGPKNPPHIQTQEH